MNTRRRTSLTSNRTANCTAFVGSGTSKVAPISCQPSSVEVELHDWLAFVSVWLAKYVPRSMKNRKPKKYFAPTRKGPANGLEKSVSGPLRAGYPNSTSPRSNDKTMPVKLGRHPLGVLSCRVLLRSLAINNLRRKSSAMRRREYRSREESHCQHRGHAAACERTLCKGPSP